MRRVTATKVFVTSLMVALLAACSTTGEVTDSVSATDPAEPAAVASATPFTDTTETAILDADAARKAAEASAEASAKAAAEAGQIAAAQAAAEAAVLAAVEQQKKEAQALSHIIYFDFDQSTIKVEFREVLNGHGAYLIDHPAAKIVLEGHTDERGTREYNMALGERRGNAVSRYLVVQGVAVDSAEVVSFGEERPINAGHDEESWSGNRRVEIKYLSY